MSPASPERARRKHGSRRAEHHHPTNPPTDVLDAPCGLQDGNTHVSFDDPISDELAAVALSRRRHAAVDVDDERPPLPHRLSPDRGVHDAVVTWIRSSRGSRCPARERLSLVADVGMRSRRPRQGSETGLVWRTCALCWDTQAPTSHGVSASMCCPLICPQWTGWMLPRNCLRRLFPFNQADHAALHGCIE
jgi:hypothetical protein